MSREHRTFDQKLSTLTDHIQNNIAFIRSQVDRGELDRGIGEALIAHNKSELDSLSSLPSGMTFKQVMENHFEKSKERNDL